MRWVLPLVLIASQCCAQQEPLLLCSVVKRLTPIAVDGAVTRPEWFPATPMPPLRAAGETASPLTGAMVWLQQDDDALFIAFRLPRALDWGRPKVTLTTANRALGRERVTQLQGGEDRVRLLFRTPGAADLVLEGNAASVFTATPEAPGVQYASRADGTGWEGEWRVPRALLQGFALDFDFASLQETPAPATWQVGLGDVGQPGALLCRLDLSPDPVSMVTPVAGATVPDRLAVLNASDQAASVSLRSALSTTPIAGRTGLTAAMWALSTASAVSATLPALARREFPLSFPSAEGMHLLVWELRSGARVMGRGLWAKRVEGPWQLTVTPFFLKYHKLRCELASSLSQPPTGKLDARFSLVATGGTVIDSASAVVRSGSAAGTLDTMKLQAGQTAQVLVEVVGPNGTKSTLSRAVTRPPDPEWWGNRLGMERTIPPGFQPIRWNLSNGTASVVLRDYRLTSGVWPQRVDSRGVALTAGPIALRAAGNARPLTLCQDNRRVAESAPDVLRLVSQGTIGDIAVTTRAQVEFDGMIRYDVTLTPPAGGSSLDSLALDIPVRREYADSYAYGYVYTDLEKARGHDNDDVGPDLAPSTGLSMGGLSRYFALHPDGFMPFCAGFYLGTYDRGLQFFAENDRGWSNASEDRVLELRREPSATVLRIHFIDQPTPLYEPRTLTFGLIATPVQDNTWERTHLGSVPVLDVNPPERDAETRPYYELCRSYGFDNAWLYLQMDGMFGAPRTYSTAQLQRLQDLNRQWQAFGLRYYYYSGWGIAPGIPGAEAFAREMYAEPVRSVGYGAYRFNLNSPYADYYLQGVKYMVQSAGARGVHLDSTYVYFGLLTNELDGYGFTRDGRKHGSWPIFATREFALRLYRLLSDRRLIPDRGLINGGFSYPMYPVCGFVTTKCAYEDYYHLKRIADIRLDGFRLRSADVLNGVCGSLGWGNWLKMPISDNEFNALCLLHGVWETGTGELLYKREMNEKDPYNRLATPLGPIRRLFAQFGATNAQFVPYYDRSPVAATGAPDTYCTAYVHPGGSALLVVGNVADRAKDVVVTPDWQRLGLRPEHVQISDGLLADRVFAADRFGTITVPVGPSLYRLLVIRNPNRAQP